MSEAPLIETPVEPGAPVAPVAPAGRWSDGFSPEVRDHPITQRLDNPEAGIRELIGAQKLIGADKVVIPGEDSTDEDRDTFYTRLGRPAKAEDYDLDSLEPPEGVPWDDEFQTSMVASMHKYGLSQAQVRGILSDYNEGVGGQFQQANGDLARAREEGINDLRKEWGNSAAEQEAHAVKAFKAGAGANYKQVAGLEMADGSIVGDNPALIRVFASLGSRMGEHGLPGGATTPTAETTASAAMDKHNELWADKKFAHEYVTADDPRHAAAVKKMENVFQTAFPVAKDE